MKQPKKQIPNESKQMCLDRIKQEYLNDCEANERTPDLSDMLDYLFSRSIITHHTLIHYFVLTFFFDFLQKCDNVKRLAYWQMENYLPIGWRQMTDIRNNYPKKFKKK